MNQRTYNSNRGGFTLVEMLVAVGLVVLMMSLFAQIISLATGSIHTQRGVAENDQKARTLITVMRSDLQKRVMRNMVPFAPNEEPETSPIPFTTREAYFYISTNSLIDDSDTVLQFIVRSSINSQNTDDSPFYGLATPVGDYASNPNQPEADDGVVEPDRNGDGLPDANFTATSTLAEVTYFLRNGNLYRRVALIREPLEIAGTSPTPTLNDVALTPIFTHANVGATYDLFAQFDFAIQSGNEDFNGNGMLDPGEDVIVPDGMLTVNPVWHGAASLSNGGATIVRNRFGQPFTRFGFDVNSGLPREFMADFGPDGTSGTADDPPNMLSFFGRYTHEETSNGAFNYPMSDSAFGNPMTSTTLLLNDGVVTQFSGGPRRGVDLLMANVHSFDVQVFDDRLQQFVPIGHAEPAGLGGVGDFHITRCLNPSYGPRGDSNMATATANARNRVFDTWNPYVDRPGGSLTEPLEKPPYRPLVYYPTDPNFASGMGPSYYRDAFGANSTTPIGPFPSNNGGDDYWQPDTEYNLGDVVFGNVGTVDLNDDGYIDGTSPPIRTTGPRLTYYYQCIQAGRSAPTGFPTWPTEPGATLTEDGRTLDVDGDFVPDIPDGNPGGPGDAIWRAFPNTVPLRAIQITIRFYNPNADQLRQVTIVQPLVD